MRRRQFENQKENKKNQEEKMENQEVKNGELIRNEKWKTRKHTKIVVKGMAVPKLVSMNLRRDCRK